MSSSLSPNQIVAWHLRRLRREAHITQERLAELMGAFGLPWTAFTVSDAELAIDRADKGRRFTADELAAIALIFYVTPTALLVPPSPEDLGAADDTVLVRVGDVLMPREAYLTDVLLMPSGVRARLVDGRLDGLRSHAAHAAGQWSDA